jgi:hypothetical protein
MPPCRLAGRHHAGTHRVCGKVEPQRQNSGDDWQHPNAAVSLLSQETLRYVIRGNSNKNKLQQRLQNHK